MPKKITLDIQHEKHRTKTINAVLEGSQKDHCLFIGPWEIYRKTFSAKIKALFTFIGLDYYFCQHMASKEESISLTRSELMWFYYESLKALDEQAAIGNQIYLIAPSALGFVALEYARIFPKQIKGVILIGMPDDLKDIQKKQEIFFLNYAPCFFNTIQSTGFSHNKWATNASNIKRYNPTVNNDETLPIKRYIAELKRDEEKYYYNMDENGNFNNSLAESMYKPWEKVNIHFRNYFFQNFMSDFNIKNIKLVNVPVLVASGLHDGIARPYAIPDMLEKGQLPENFTYYIFDKSAHMPHYEQPNEFTEQVEQWKCAISNSADEKTSQTHLSIKSSL